MVGIERDCLQIEFPLDNGVDYTDTDVLKKYLIDNQDEFEPYFIRLISLGDSRITILENSMTVGDITTSGNGEYTADVRFYSHYFMGCKDLDSTSDHEAVLEFNIVENVMFFDIELPPEWVPE